MATSSFSKNIILKNDAVEKICKVQNQDSKNIPSATSISRVKEGKEALTQFSFRSKR